VRSPGAQINSSGVKWLVVSGKRDLSSSESLDVEQLAGEQLDKWRLF